ncbi:leucyl/phenylalanyl-tRNA--protein transferase [Tibeticola sediminis]|uniref:Leucyl/phenylalanyl-tRNA--protein transferase n=1 Tax=Tibeticola sediminis TaxID=1917811 RepID=A0A3N4UXZ6_9BURK|nr:leucyl/phenylalanyl-tRNA--protein transferase [Tibeticola sediminis]RPE72439.1 leucyl/phenylalanyl-tRNA--protein transferase [Tibeticola sediminis]
MRRLPLLRPGEPFPPVGSAWGPETPAPGLLAAGGALDMPTLLLAYSSGIFPWYADDQPILWWSPDPRMVLDVADFRLHRSLRKTLLRFTARQGCAIRFDSAFDQVIEACALAPRSGQAGTWITSDMRAAYQRLHAHGYAHSVETWIDGALVGGLYCVSIGRAVFGESMFARATDASKIALSALVAFCRAENLPLIDCQQNTRHLASLGAREIARSDFLNRIRALTPLPPPSWTFRPVYWQTLLASAETQP